MLLRLKQLFRTVTTSSQDANFARAFFRLFGNQYHVADYDVNDVIENTYEYNDAVFRAVKLLIDAMAQLKYKIVEQTPEGENVITDHPFYNVLEQPNIYQTWLDFMSLEMTYFLVTGNSFIYKVFPDAGINNGQVQALHIFPPQLVDIVRSENFFEPVKYFEIQYLGDLRLDLNKVIHRKTVQLDYESPYGMSPLEPAKRLVTTSNDAKTAAMKLLQNSGMQGILTGKSLEGLDEESLKAVADGIRANFTGAGNKGRFPIVSDPMEWIQIGMKSSDLELLKQDLQSEKQIAGLWNIPSGLMSSDESSTLDNLKQWRQQLYTNAAIPQFNRLLESLTRQALWSYGNRNLKLVADTSAVPELQEDKKALSESLQKADWLSINEKRAYFKADPMEAPEADLPYKMLDLYFGGAAESQEVNENE